MWYIAAMFNKNPQIMKTLSIAALLCLVVFASCDNSKDNPQPSKTDLLTASSWELISVGGGTPFEVYIFTFEADGDFKYSNPRGNGSGSWKWDLNETEIEYTLGTTKTEGKLNSLTTLELRVVWSTDNNKESLYKPK